MNPLQQVRSTAADARSREGLRPLDLDELLALEIKPREMVLDPIIPEKSLTMIYGLRGIGKTHVALGIACAVASGTHMLGWRAPKPRRFLRFDGESPGVMLRERLQSVAGDAGIAPEMLKVLAGDLVDDGMGNLGSPAVQAELEPMVDAADLVILDNLASLSEFFHDDAIGWKPIEQWLVRLRRRGRAVLIVHHAGRSGTPRGTSRREDLLDTSISLQRPLDYSPTQGARFEVHIEKSRVILGEAAAPFEATRDRARQDGVDHDRHGPCQTAAHRGIAQCRVLAARHRRGNRPLQVGGASAQAEAAKRAAGLNQMIPIEFNDAGCQAGVASVDARPNPGTVPRAPGERRARPGIRGRVP